MHKVFFTEESEKCLKKIHPKDSKKTVNCIFKLKNPYDKSLNLKKMEEENYWRLRIGKIRVVYEIDKKQKIVIIRRVAYRGHAYKK